MLPVPQPQEELGSWSPLREQLSEKILAMGKAVVVLGTLGTSCLYLQFLLPLVPDF